jgi:plastocyanin
VAVGAGVAVLAVLGGCGGGGDDGAQPYREPKGPADETLTIAADNFSFDPDDPEVSAGIVELEMDVEEGTHTLVFDDNRVPGFQLEGNSGEKVSKKVELAPGKYTFYCDITGHRAQGMEGAITVE